MLQWNNRYACTENKHPYLMLLCKVASVACNHISNLSVYKRLSKSSSPEGEIFLMEFSFLHSPSGSESVTFLIPFYLIFFGSSVDRKTWNLKKPRRDYNNHFHSCLIFSLSNPLLNKFKWKTKISTKLRTFDLSLIKGNPTLVTTGKRRNLEKL